MKYFEDVAYVVLVALLIPFFIAFGWVALSMILIRQTYWALRGNSTVRPHAAAVPVRGGH